MALGGIGHEAAHVVLGVKALDGSQHVVHAYAARGLGGEARIVPDLDAPGLVVDEVEVEGVELIAGHLVDKAQEGVEGDELAGGVDHEFAQGGAGASVTTSCGRTSQQAAWPEPRRSWSSVMRP